MVGWILIGAVIFGLAQCGSDAGSTSDPGVTPSNNDGQITHEEACAGLRIARAQDAQADEMLSAADDTYCSDVP